MVGPIFPCQFLDSGPIENRIYISGERGGEFVSVLCSVRVCCS